MYSLNPQRRHEFYYAALGLGLFVAWLLALGLIQITGIDMAYMDIGPAVFSLAAAVALSIAAYMTWPTQKQISIAWGLIALAMVMNTVGEISWNIMQLGLKIEPYPSIADIFYLSYYPLFLAGVFLFPVLRHSIAIRVKISLEAIIVLISAGLFLWNFILGPLVADSAGEGFLIQVYSVAYPLCDLLVLIALLKLVFWHQDSINKGPLLILILGVVMVLLSDVLWSVFSFEDEYLTRNLSNSGYVLTYVLLGLAGIRHWHIVTGRSPGYVVSKPSEKTARPNFLHVYLPSATLIASYILLVYSYDNALPMDFSDIALFLGVIIILAILVKIIDSRDNNKLNRELEERTIELAQANLDLKNEVESRKRYAEALQVSETLYRAVVEDLPVFICRFQTDGTLTFVNQAYCDYFNQKREDLVGQSFFSLIPEEDRQVIKDHYSSLTLENPVVKYEHRVYLPGGEIRWQRWIDRAIFEDNALVEYQSIGEDITEKRLAEERLVRSAYYDPLTGLANRSMLLEQVQLSINKARRNSKSHYAVVFLDLDNFKFVNDSLGHSVGDALLISVAERINNCVRHNDLVARPGGDEFVILLNEIEGIMDAIHIVQRILNEIREPHDLKVQSVRITASIGIVYNNFDEEAEGNLRDADIAMYRAKLLGKDRFELFETELRTQAIERLKMENDLRNALNRLEFVLHYQPIYSFKDMQIIGFEALLRWQHPERGLVYPKEFIQLTEETSLIIPIGSWILAEACRQIKIWHLMFPHDPPLFISVNISVKQLTQPDFSEQVRKTLVDSELDPRSLVLELTESAIMENIEQNSKILAAVAELGVHIHLDDFGTGYSSLGRLQELPIDTIKIDRSFVNQIASSDNHSDIVRAITILSHELGLGTIAEGVEYRYQLDYLTELGCNMGQGFYFTKAVGEREVPGMIRAAQKGILPQAEPEMNPEKVQVGEIRLLVAQNGSRKNSNRKNGHPH